MPKKNDKKAERPRTTAFESPIAKAPLRDDATATGRNPDEIAERAGTNVEFKG